ncbi:ribonuclease HII [Fusobacterium gastrosuis]|uniref:ribonuclease HII n=1 Tax=Fusobacterium gastrosuis TaxID=1755100 RepID=UPI002971DE85|nr:ribonuclease HII [Fusobacteriaceae bacterium]MDY5712575.1 ribonuclease HII [Fusobacterium gastrosuis]
MSNNSLYLFDLDFKEVIGVDEAGRGPLAGPVVAAAVKLKKYSEVLDEINDSKKLTEKKREKLYDIIVENFEIGVGVVSAIEIDKVNILNATFLAMRKALCELQDKLKDYERNIVLVDGNFKIREYKGEQVPIVKGDAKSLSIAAASIIAKVTRDRMMRELDKVYPNYDFSKHKGYGTKKHVEILKKMGPIKGIHRNSFLGKIL